MRALAAAEVLHLWDLADAKRPTQRALALLRLARTEDDAALARLSIGTRDAHLLELRAQTFGKTLQARTRCPVCAERLEFDLDIAVLLAPRAGMPSQMPTWYEERFGIWTVQFRLPCSLDLLALEARGEARELHRTLFERCLGAVHHEASPCEPSALPAAVTAQVIERMAALDPCADIVLSLNCNACDHQWCAPLDIVSHVWSDLSAHARRLLREVDVLARAYGWREADILALGSARRRAYLELADA